MSESIRIRTTPNGNDNYVTLKVEQDFDFIEILSLKLSQDKVYETFCADYGAIVGRVIINNGFGIPNARVSVFIPITDEDKQNPLIKGLYPYENVNDVNSDGIRYNLLPKESENQDNCYSPIGTFPAKREFLDSNELLEVYCKYYKYTTVTNTAGDFMLFGVPIGNYVIHVDADISNIGIASQRPYDLIEQGTPSKLFNSPTKYKTNKNLNSLIQVKSANAGVNVKPFWGDIDNCQIGINRVDFDLNYNTRPCAIFMGSIFGDSEKNSINKRCRPRKGMGMMCEQITREGTVEMIRKTYDDQIEQFDVEGGRVIDQNGAWAYQIPMNLDYMVTDEFGNLVPSDSEDKGIPTKSRVRFRISMDEGGGIGRLRTRGKYLIPQNPANESEIDFSFDKTTKDTPHTFRDIYWNKIYSVKNFISRTEKEALLPSKVHKIKKYTGIKNVDACVGDKLPMPFNRTHVKGNILFTILCVLFNFIAIIIYGFNSFLCALLLIKIPFTSFRIFGFLKKWMIKVTCPNEADKQFTIGFCADSIDDFMNCIKAVLADEFDLYQFDFYNDWVNGSLYYYLLKYKKTRRGKEKFCETNCRDFPNGTGNNSCKNSILRDTTITTKDAGQIQRFRNGLLVKYDGNLYYPPMILRGGNFKLFPTDLVNLGSVFDCDWQGFPKIIDYLTSTSYKIPPLVTETPADETSEINDDDIVVPGMFTLEPAEGLFFTIKCLIGIDYDSLKAKNIRRQCELNVDITEGTLQNTPNYIGINQIIDPDQTDVLYSINRYVRDSFYLLNVNGPSISSLASGVSLLQNTQGTSFGINGPNLNGSEYNNFRGWFPNSNSDMAFQTKNSFYMYFGIIPGSTAMEKVKSKFFISCEKTILDEFVIDTTIQNTSYSGLLDGLITFTIIGGIGPFTYTVIGLDVNYSLPSTIITTNLPTVIVPLLAAGTYQITVIDALGTIVIKDVEVGGPTPLSCSFYVFQQPSNITTAADGSIQVNQIYGGHLPYTMIMQYPNGSTVNYTQSNMPSIGDIISNLTYGQYTLTVSDSIGDICISTLTLTGPTPITISNVEIFDACNGCNGSVIFDINGGTSPYIISLITSTGTIINDMSSFGNLCDGTYTIKVTDSGEPQIQSTTYPINIGSGPTYSIVSILTPILTKKLFTVTVSGGQIGDAPDYYTVLLSDKSMDFYAINGGAYIYNLEVNSSDWTGSLQIIDGSGCDKKWNLGSW